LNIILFLAWNFDSVQCVSYLPEGSFPIPESFYDISHLLFCAVRKDSLGEFFSSTIHAIGRRLPAAARRRTEVHRVRAVRQEQRRNRKKEPLKTKLLSKTNPILTCKNEG